MDDSFAERMRNRALQKLQRNAHILKNNDLNKENVSKNLVIPANTEYYLSMKKNLFHNKMDCDDSEPKNPNNTCDSMLSERNVNEEQREDGCVKQCKNRLANLAGKFKQFEEEDMHMPLRPTALKQAPIKRRTQNKESPVKVAPKTVKYESVALREKENQPFRITRKQANPTIPQNIVLPKNKKLVENVDNTPNKPEKKVLDRSIVNTLESQGYQKTESNAHAIFNFKKARDVFDKTSENNSNKKENSIDPSLLSVGERRKLFEKRLRGEETPNTFGYPNSPIPGKSKNTTHSQTTHQHGTPSPILNINEVSDEDTNSNHSLKSNLSDHLGNEKEPKKAAILNIMEETCTSFPDPPNDQNVDISGYPVLETVKQVKFVSTPKPGHLYPSMPDLECDADESANDDEFRTDISKNDTSFSINEHDNSFGRDVLFATNSIFSSFQNSRRENSALNDKTNTDALTEVKELICRSNNTSLSLSPVARSSLNSVECPNETASFTYIKAYSNISNDLFHVSATADMNNSKNIAEKSDAEEPFVNEKEDLNNEIDVATKIKLLEEKIIKEKITLMQAVRALKLCLSTSFVNSLSHLEAEKLALLSELKIVAAQNEINRIKVADSILSQTSAPSSARGDVIISNIKLPIRMAIVHADLKDDTYNNLLCVIKCGDIVLSTEVVPVVQNKIKQNPECVHVEFTNAITVPNVSPDFKISIEVYNLVVENKDSANFKQQHSGKKNKKGKRDAKKEKGSHLFPKGVEDKNHSQSSFLMVGFMSFSLKEIKRHQWTLNQRDLHHTPLVGMMMMNLKCNPVLTYVQKRGFLTMYEVISGYGAWSRYWFYLCGEKLSFWKYPEEENVKAPIGTFDLKHCRKNLIDVVGIEITMRPYTFMLQFNPSSYLLKFKGLNEDGLLLSADNLPERKAWCLCLSEILKSIHSWSNTDE